MGRDVSLFSSLEEKKRRICEAAINIFAKKSFTKTTVSEIAARAGVGKGTFYLYFKSKKELLNFLLEHGIDSLISEVRTKIKQKKYTKEKLRIAIDIQLEFFARHHQYFTFFVRELWSYREGLKKQINHLKKNYIVIFERLINNGVEEGIFKNVNVETIASGLFGFLSISSSHWILFSQEFPAQDINNSINKVFFRGLLAE